MQLHKFVFCIGNCCPTVDATLHNRNLTQSSAVLSLQCKLQFFNMTHAQVTYRDARLFAMVMHKLRIPHNEQHNPLLTPNIHTSAVEYCLQLRCEPVADHGCETENNMRSREEDEKNERIDLILNQPCCQQNIIYKMWLPHCAACRSMLHDKEIALLSQPVAWPLCIAML